MRIAYLGNFNEAWCTETHIALTLEDLGHSVIRLQENQSTLSDIIGQAETCDLFLWTRTYGWLGCDGFQMLSDLKQRGITTASLHLDFYFGISRERALKDDAFWFTDYVFQPDGDNLDRFRELGINAYWSPPAVYKGGCYLFDRPKVHDLVFVGSSGGYHGEWPWRQELIRNLSTVYPQFELYPKDHAVRESELNDLYSSTKVSVGDSIMSDRNRTYTTDRIFETTGRGGFIIYPDIPWVTEQFDGHLVTYDPGNWQDLKEKIDFWLDPRADSAREEKRILCHNITKEFHTYHNRLTKIIETING